MEDLDQQKDINEPQNNIEDNSDPIDESPKISRRTALALLLTGTAITSLLAQTEVTWAQDSTNEEYGTVPPPPTPEPPTELEIYDANRKWDFAKRHARERSITILDRYAIDTVTSEAEEPEELSDLEVYEMVQSVEKLGGFMDIKPHVATVPMLVPLNIEVKIQTELAGIAKIKGLNPGDQPFSAYWFWDSGNKSPVMGYDLADDGTYYLTDGTKSYEELYGRFKEASNIKEAVGDGLEFANYPQIDPYTKLLRQVVREVYDPEAAFLISTDGIPPQMGFGQMYENPDPNFEKYKICGDIRVPPKSLFNHSIYTSAAQCDWLVNPENSVEMDGTPALKHYIAERYQTALEQEEVLPLGVVIIPKNADKMNIIESLDSNLEGKDLDKLNLIFITSTSNEGEEVYIPHALTDYIFMATTVSTGKDGNMQLDDGSGVIPPEKANGHLLGVPATTAALNTIATLTMVDGKPIISWEYGEYLAAGVSYSVFQLAMYFLGKASLLKRNGIEPTARNVQQAVLEQANMNKYIRDGITYEVGIPDIYDFAREAGFDIPESDRRLFLPLTKSPLRQ